MSNVVFLENQNCTEMPVAPTPPPPASGRAYEVELETENLDLRNLVAAMALEHTRKHSARRAWESRLKVLALVVVAFGIGWVLEPPTRLIASLTGSAVAVDTSYESAAKPSRAQGRDWTGDGMILHLFATKRGQDI